MHDSLPPTSSLRVAQAPLIYLAGPIYNQTEFAATDWRKHVSNQLAPHNIVGVSPLRCQPAHNGKYDISYPNDSGFGDARAILAKNWLDLNRCDMTLAYFPKPERESDHRSIGTIGECAWAYALRKPLVLVTDDPLIMAHPFTACQPTWPVLKSLDDALRLIVGLFEVYAGARHE